MKTLLAIFCLLMASITFWAVRDGINEGHTIIIYKDSTAYWHGRYDSVVRLRSWTKLDSIYKDLGKIGDYIPSEDSIRYDSAIRASIHQIFPVRHSRHRDSDGFSNISWKSMGEGGIAERMTLTESGNLILQDTINWHRKYDSLLKDCQMDFNRKVWTKILLMGDTSIHD